MGSRASHQPFPLPRLRSTARRAGTLQKFSTGDHPRGEEILVGNGWRLGVVDIVPLDDEDSQIDGLLEVEAA